MRTDALLANIVKALYLDCSSFLSNQHGLTIYPLEPDHESWGGWGVGGDWEVEHPTGETRGLRVGRIWG